MRPAVLAVALRLQGEHLPSGHLEGLWADPRHLGEGRREPRPSVGRRLVGLVAGVLGVALLPRAGLREGQKVVHLTMTRR